MLLSGHIIAQSGPLEAVIAAQLSPYFGFVAANGNGPYPIQQSAVDALVAQKGQSLYAGQELQGNIQPETGLIADLLPLRP